MFLDFENALHHGYAKQIGVDFEPPRLLYYAPTTLEEGLKMIYVAVKQGVKLIVVDSVSAMVPKSELDKKLDDPAKIGALAAAMSTNLPKIVQWLKGTDTCLVLLNQIRSLISSTARGDTDNTSGGKAVKFYASVRLKLTRIKSEILEKPDPITLKKKRIPFGNLVQVKVVKNKIDSKQGATGEIFIRYGYGIDEYMSVIEAALPRRIIVKDGSGFAYGPNKTRGREQFRKFLADNPKVYTEIQQKVTAALLAAAPEPLSPDEIDENDLIADMNRELGDDQIFDSESESASEEVIEEDAGGDEAEEVE
jgi:recombination protein RecA